MIELFTEPITIEYPVVKWPEFNYIQSTYRKEILNIEDYYHTRTYAVKSNHLLTTLLWHINVPLAYQADRYVEAARARAPYVSRAVRMTSELQYGKIHDGVFYGKGCDEIILAIDEYFDPYAISANWQDIAAVRPLLHPKSDLKLLLPNGKVSSSETGLAVIAVNIPLLVFQYRCFMLSQIGEDSSPVSMLSIAHFIHKYVLPNMLRAQTDIVILNRMMNLFYGIPMGIGQFKHPFMVTDYSKRIDAVLAKEIARLQDNSHYYAAMLLNIPTISAEDMGDALRLPEIAPTRQVWWAIMVSRIPVMRFLVELGGEASQSKNLMLIGHIQRKLKRLENEHSLQSLLPNNLYFTIKADIDFLMSL